jgi:hypothetical protein
MANLLDSRHRILAAATARHGTCTGMMPGVFAAFPRGAILVPHEQFVERRERLRRVLAELARRDPDTPSKAEIVPMADREQDLDETW